MDRIKIAIELFTAYCNVRKMNPADWPIIGDEKQAAWLAAADVTINLMRRSYEAIGSAAASVHFNDWVLGVR
jgi:hypothetical protein